MEGHGRFTSNRRVERALPVLDARLGGPSERFACRLRGRHPAAVFFAAILAGLAVLVLIGIALGLLVTDVLLHTGGLARTDESAVRSLVAERTPVLTDASEVGSALGGAPLLPILVGLIALVCARLRQWRIAAFAVFVLAVESATYRVTSLVVPRERPRGDAARRPSGERLLPVRSHGGVRRRLRRSRPAHHVTVLPSRRATARVGRRDPGSGVRRLRPDVPRHAPPARRRRRVDPRQRGTAGAAVRVPRGGRRARGTSSAALSVCVPKRNEEKLSMAQNVSAPTHRSGARRAKAMTSRGPGSSSGWPAPASPRAA